MSKLLALISQYLRASVDPEAIEWIAYLKAMDSAEAGRYDGAACRERQFISTRNQPPPGRKYRFS
ncbi:MAG: hypothetical protein IOC66_16540 [Burkholderia sp.]|jgi:hypothetical protein|nr:hypothetical protein [Burkholderia sp.]